MAYPVFDKVYNNDTDQKLQALESITQLLDQRLPFRDNMRQIGLSQAISQKGKDATEYYARVTFLFLVLKLSVYCNMHSSN